MLDYVKAINQIDPSGALLRLERNFLFRFGKKLLWETITQKRPKLMPEPSQGIIDLALIMLVIGILPRFQTLIHQFRVLAPHTPRLSASKTPPSALTFLPPPQA
jgi:hypothetical protein